MTLHKASTRGLQADEADSSSEKGLLNQETRWHTQGKLQKALVCPDLHECLISTLPQQIATHIYKSCVFHKLRYNAPAREFRGILRISKPETAVSENLLT